VYAITDSDERDERLTFFVHDDVADGERDPITDLETLLGRNLPNTGIPRPCSKY